MLSNITNNDRWSLLCLAAILFIAAGIPLIHPAFHHEAHGQTNVDHSPAHFPALPIEDEDHGCPICDYQATNPLTINGLMPRMAADQPFVAVLQTIHLFVTKTFVVQAEPRAPPFFT
jgi:hypothetical protein